MKNIKKLLLLVFMSLLIVVVPTSQCYVYALDTYSDVNNLQEIIEPIVLPQITLTNIEIPTNTYAKTYEDGSLITDPTSLAYKWINKCSISDKGHYMYEDCYAVAMGNYFAPVGSKFRVTLDTGRIFDVIKCDVKQDRHTVNKMIDGCGAMLEFIIDTDKAGSYYGIGGNGYIMNGSFNNHESFNGNVVKIELIEEV